MHGAAPNTLTNQNLFVSSRRGVVSQPILEWDA